MLLHPVGDEGQQREIATLSIDPSTGERTPTCRYALVGEVIVMARYQGDMGRGSGAAMRRPPLSSALFSHQPGNGPPGDSRQHGQTSKKDQTWEPVELHLQDLKHQETQRQDRSPRRGTDNHLLS